MSVNKVILVGNVGRDPRSQALRQRCCRSKFSRLRLLKVTPLKTAKK